MNLRKLFTLATLGLAALFMALAIVVTPPPSSAAPAKVNLCHRTGNGGFQPISVGANASGAHLAHGDVQQPNGEVPGSPGYVFDSQCNAVTGLFCQRRARLFGPGSSQSRKPVRWKRNTCPKLRACPK